MNQPKTVDAAYRVSVVIPTTLRPELTRAVQSVLAQSVGIEHLEILIVVDAPTSADELNVLKNELGLSQSDSVVATGGGRGGGAARRIGTERSTGDWIAYLDDDDEWHPDKLASQLAVAADFHETTDNYIISSKVAQRSSDSSGSIVVPFEIIRPGQKVAEYLFHKRRPSVQRASLYTSTFLAPYSLARAISWRTDLRRHQDWDWIMRAEKHGAQVIQLDEPLVTIWTGTNGSISASADWESSLRWATDTSTTWPDNVLPDFLAAQTLRYAFHARSMRGITRTVLAIAKTKQFPSLSCVLIAAGGLVDRRLLEVLLLRGTKRK
ncbi:glycosyl transferase family 2 [Arthrobacter sp. AG367]|uniref:glycosyltransferase n=1 Tax=Arthrobacter sp. AG367 TaxID=2572909 RepID=UPI0011ACA336|nr:glycosyltransferase [Arthrobacter sp. AG367]TWD48168.1 glycosyl transferase family 2 [Arthrobacter sp. AG367]